MAFDDTAVEVGQHSVLEQVFLVGRLLVILRQGFWSVSPRRSVPHPQPDLNGLRRTQGGSYWERGVFRKRKEERQREELRLRALSGCWVLAGRQGTEKGP